MSKTFEAGKSYRKTGCVTMLCIGIFEDAAVFAYRANNMPSGAVCSTNIKLGDFKIYEEVHVPVVVTRYAYANPHGTNNYSDIFDRDYKHNLKLTFHDGKLHEVEPID